MHLFFIKNKLDQIKEEKICYDYELNFLLKIPNVEPWLIKHASINK